ncbi:MAG TPA: site-specific integrase, partial [Solirubrobacterales bacterium]
MAIAIKPQAPKAAAKPGADKRFESLLLDFLSYLELERGLSRNTLNAYRTDLLQYGEYLSAHDRDALQASAADVADFLAELATGEGRPACSAATIHRKAACLRSFYKHLRRDELIV